MSKNNRYDGNSFQFLEGLEMITVNPQMYLGSKGREAIKKLLVEIMDNSKDEATPLKDIRRLKMKVTLYPDGSACVEDNGRGIPVDINEKTGLPAIYLAFEKIHSGAKLRNMENSFYEDSIGVHGVGLSAVNACSEFVNVQVKRDGKIYEVRYRNNGKEREDLKVIGECSPNETGTKIHFKYDSNVLDCTDDEKGELDYPFIVEEIDEIIRDYVMFTDNFEAEFYWDTGEKEEGVEFTLRGKKGGKVYNKDEYNINNLIKKYSNDESLILHYKDKNDELDYKIEILYSFTDFRQETIKLSVVNGLRMILGSSQQRAFEDEVFKFFENVFKSTHKIQQGFELTKPEVVNKLNYIIVLNTSHRDFINQAKQSYSNDKITMDLREKFRFILSEMPSEVITRAVSAIEFEYKEKIKQIKAYEKKKEERMPRKNKRDTQKALEKFNDCRNGIDMRHKNRVWFLEGDSAANSFAKSRDSSFEAYAPLRGKPLNVIKNSIIRNRTDKKGRKESVEYEQFMLIRSIVEMKKFSSYIICTDADVDGLHIRNLISYIFYKYFPEIILRGQLYIAEAPLFKMKKGKEIKYAYYDYQAEELKKQGYTVVERYKGLGEMKGDELYKVLTDPNESNLIQITLDDIDKSMDIYLPDEEDLEENIDKVAIEYIAGKDASLRRELAKEFMSEKLCSYLEKENKIRNKFVSKINPLYLDEDGKPLTQEQIDFITVEREISKGLNK